MQGLHKWHVAPSHFPQVQFQDNPSDGAVFVLQYVENFLKVSQKSERLEKNSTVMPPLLASCMQQYQSVQ